VYDKKEKFEKTTFGRIRKIRKGTSRGETGMIKSTYSSSVVPQIQCMLTLVRAAAQTDTASAPQIRASVSDPLAPASNPFR
jgi:hypothetical protein